MFDCYGDVPLSFSMFFSMFRDFDLRALTVDEFLDLGLTIPCLLYTSAAQGEEGEICIRGTCLTHGYYGNKEKTKEAFVQNPLNSYSPDVRISI